ncbi:MAG: YraN family protein [Alphaproteobacteria bacterium]|nr:YraN family protein [Alphaproteobacteria bacterium]
MNSYESGLFAEFLAKMYLRAHGFRIVKSRYITGRNTGRAEIDIIARRRNLMIFVEVKRRPDVPTAWAGITPAQSVRLRRAAENFIAKTGWTGDTRFDAILVCGLRVYWARGAL